MTAPSPVCTVNTTATTNGVDVTGGTTPTVRLVSAAGVNVWLLECIGTDENTTPATINATISIDTVNKTATFTAPAGVSALIFRSRVNGGSDTNGTPQASYTTTFKVSVLTAGGNRVLALGESYENNATSGWVGVVNALIRGVGGVFTLAGDATGPSNASVVERIRGKLWSTTPPTEGQAPLWSSSAQAWTPGTIATTLSGDVTGAASDNTVTKIRNKLFSATPPTNLQVAQFVSATQTWTPTTLSIPGGDPTMGNNCSGTASACIVTKIQSCTIPAAVLSSDIGMLLGATGVNQYGLVAQASASPASVTMTAGETVTANTGTVVLQGGTLGKAWKAITAAMSTYGQKAAVGVVTTGGAANASIVVQCMGTLTPTQCGWAATPPAAGYVRVKLSDGTLERVDDFAIGDIPVGYVNTAGYLTLILGDEFWNANRIIAEYDSHDSTSYAAVLGTCSAASVWTVFAGLNPELVKIENLLSADVVHFDCTALITATGGAGHVSLASQENGGTVTTIAYTRRDLAASATEHHTMVGRYAMATSGTLYLIPRGYSVDSGTVYWKSPSEIKYQVTRP